MNVFYIFFGILCVYPTTSLCHSSTIRSGANYDIDINQSMFNQPEMPHHHGFIGDPAAGFSKTYEYEVECVEYSDGYDYIGCDGDTSTRALPYGPHRDGYTPETCATACAAYRYFALQNEGWCYCDNNRSYFTQYGTMSTCPASRLGAECANDLFENTSTIYAAHVEKGEVGAEASGSSFSIDCDDKVIEILSAKYGLNCGATKDNQSSNLQDACNGETSCDYTVNHAVIDDPAWGCAKTYEYEYECVERDYFKYIGCYKDTGNRALRHGPHAYGYTPETCSIACAGWVFVIMIVEPESFFYVT